MPYISIENRRINKPLIRSVITGVAGGMGQYFHALGQAVDEKDRSLIQSIFGQMKVGDVVKVDFQDDHGFVYSGAGTVEKIDLQEKTEGNKAVLDFHIFMKVAPIPKNVSSIFTHSVPEGPKAKS